MHAPQRYAAGIDESFFLCQHPPCGRQDRLRFHADKVVSSSARSSLPYSSPESQRFTAALYHQRSYALPGTMGNRNRFCFCSSSGSTFAYEDIDNDLRTNTDDFLDKGSPFVRLPAMCQAVKIHMDYKGGTFGLGFVILNADSKSCAAYSRVMRSAPTPARQKCFQPSVESSHFAAIPSVIVRSSGCCIRGFRFGADSASVSVVEAVHLFDRCIRHFCWRLLCAASAQSSSIQRGKQRRG